MSCARMRLNYFVVDVLPSRQIKRVARLPACNYDRCVFVTIFSGCKIRLRRLQIITFDKSIKRTAEAIQSIQRSKYAPRFTIPVYISPVRGLRLTLTTHFNYDTLCGACLDCLLFNFLCMANTQLLTPCEYAFPYC